MLQVQQQPSQLCCTWEGSPVPYWLRCVTTKSEFTGSRLRWIAIAGWPGRYLNVRHYWRLSMVLLQLKDPLELFVKRREFLSGLSAQIRVSTSSQYDLNCWKRHKNPLLPFIFAVLVQLDYHIQGMWGTKPQSCWQETNSTSHNTLFATYQRWNLHPNDSKNAV